MTREALQATVRRAAQFGERFLRWWGGELLALVPRRLRRRMTASGPCLRFEMLGQRLLLRTRHQGRRRTLGAWDLGACDLGEAGPDLAAAVERAVRKAGLTRAPVLVRPAAEQVFRRPMSLPEQAEANLREVLSFEIDRRTPFRPDRVFATHRITGRQPDQERIEVELIVVPKRTLAPMLAAIADAGLCSPGVEVPGPAGQGRMVIPVTAAEQAGGGRRSAWLPAGAGMLAALLLVAAIVVRLDRLGEEAARLDDALRVATAEAAKADRLREEVATLSREMAVFLERKRTTPPFLAVLNELANILPDHTWTHELHIRGKEVQIVGQSASAAGLIEKIEYSPMFRKANFTSPVTRQMNEERERFHLAFEVEPLDAPKLADGEANTR